jgi:probable HAF family extracellular repeat protein
MAYGVNDQEQIVGYYHDANGKSHAFIYEEGNWTSFDHPNGTDGTVAYGINEADEIVGVYKDGSGIHSNSSGAFTTFDTPTPPAASPKLTASTSQA